MPFRFAFLAVLLLGSAFAKTAAAQSTAPYDVICTEAGPKVTTPTDTVGVVIDTADLDRRVTDLDAQLRRISLDEIELRLIREKDQATASRELLLDIRRRARDICNDVEPAKP